MHARAMLLLPLLSPLLNFHTSTCDVGGWGNSITWGW